MEAGSKPKRYEIDSHLESFINKSLAEKIIPLEVTLNDLSGKITALSGSNDKLNTNFKSISDITDRITIRNEKINERFDEQSILLAAMSTNFCPRAAL